MYIYIYIKYYIYCTYIYTTMTTYHSTAAVLHIIVIANSGTLATQRFEGSSRDPGWDPHSHKLPMTLTLESTAASFSDPNCALHLLVQ